MDSYEIECYLKAGKIAGQIKKDLENDFIKYGIKLLDIADFIESKTHELGGVPAFPVNLGINDVAAHYTPIPKDDKVAQGLLKIDFGVCVDGYIADTAICFDLSEDKRYSEIIKLNKKILDEINRKLNTNSEIKDVGEIASNVLENFNIKNNTNYNLVHSLCGHGLDKDVIHTGLVIPNYKNNSSKKIKNISFAIEPFISTGSGDIYEGKCGNIYCINSNLNVRDKDSREILTFIKENYKTRPFCERWLIKSGFKKTNYILKILESSKIVYHYPMLMEKTKGIVSQVENTFISFDDKVICTSS